MDIFAMVLSFLGGLGLFMYGMKIMGEGLERAAGDRMRHMIEVFTTNRFRGVLVGTVVTAIIQSSSATTVMLIGFVNAGLMNLSQTVGVIMGANIGTTITAQLIAFKLTKIAPVALCLGVGVIFFSKNRGLKKMAEILIGFGLLFMGMDFMSGAMKPLRSNEAFINFMVHFDNPILGVLAGCLITMIIQSSSASIGILQAFAMQQLIGLDAAVFILFGQNIGTCITAMLASIGANVTARRTAAVHLLFNVFGTVLFLLLIMIGVPYTDFVRLITGENVVRQIANAHTIFNVANVMIMLPMSSALVTIAERLVPGKEEKKEAHQVKFIDERILLTPPIAVAQILKEINRMALIALDNVSRAVDSFIEGDMAPIKRIYEAESVINYLNHEITQYLVKVSGLELSEDDLRLVGGLFHVVSDIERIGDHAENIAEFSELRVDKKLKLSKSAAAELIEMKECVVEMLNDAIRILDNRDKNDVVKIGQKEAHIDELKRQLRNKHIKRLSANKCTPDSGIAFIDVISNLERVADHATNIAYSVLED